MLWVLKVFDLTFINIQFYNKYQTFGDLVHFFSFSSRLYNEDEIKQLFKALKHKEWSLK